MERIRSWVIAHVPDAVVEEKTYHGQIRFAVPAHSNPVSSSDMPSNGNSKTDDEITSSPPDTSMSSSSGRKPGRGNISALFTLLEENKGFLGLEYYSVSQTTLDQVFLKIVGQHQIEEENYDTAERTGVWAWLVRRYFS